MSGELYHYQECGLDNVWIKGGVKYHNTPYGHGVSIHEQENLHKVIGLDIAKSLYKMKPQELRFLRIEMELSQKNLGALIGVDAQTIARWEKNETEISGPAELLIKSLYIQHAGENPDIQNLCHDLAELDETEYAQERQFMEECGEWHKLAQ